MKKSAIPTTARRRQSPFIRWALPSVLPTSYASVAASHKDDGADYHSSQTCDAPLASCRADALACQEWHEPSSLCRVTPLLKTFRLRHVNGRRIINRAPLSRSCADPAGAATHAACPLALAPSAPYSVYLGVAYPALQ